MRIPVLLMGTQIDFGGTERQIAQTAKFLDRSVFEPHVGCLRAGGMGAEELREAGVPVAHFPVHSYKSPAAIREARHIARYVRDHGIRIVHTWDYPLNVYAIPITRLFTRAIAISSQRAHRELTPVGYRTLSRVARRLSHRIVVNCGFVRQHLIDDEHVPASKIEVCYNGLDLRRFRHAAGSRAAFGLSSTSLVIGCVCVLRPEKDVGTLIDAFSKLRQSVPDCTLVIVGAGSELSRLQRHAQEVGVEPHCRFERATDRVAEWLSAMDIFVLPSLTEALSNSLMEAMACGCCAVASEIGGNPELVRDGETGMLFRPGDVDGLTRILQMLAGDAGERARLAGNGERFLRENFSIEAAAKRFGDLYARLLAR